MWSRSVPLVCVILVGLLINDLYPFSNITSMKLPTLGSSQSRRFMLKSPNNKHSLLLILFILCSVYSLLLILCSVIIMVII